MDSFKLMQCAFASLVVQAQIFYMSTHYFDGFHHIALYRRFMNYSLIIKIRFNANSRVHTMICQVCFNHLADIDSSFGVQCRNQFVIRTSKYVINLEVGTALFTNGCVAFSHQVCQSIVSRQVRSMSQIHTQIRSPCVGRKRMEFNNALSNQSYGDVMHTRP